MSTVPVPPVAAPEAKLAVDVWADLTCAWCYLGKRRLERAITAFEHPHAVTGALPLVRALWPRDDRARDRRRRPYAAAAVLAGPREVGRGDEGLVLTSRTPYRRARSMRTG